MFKHFWVLTKCFYLCNTLYCWNINVETLLKMKILQILKYLCKKYTKIHWICNLIWCIEWYMFKLFSYFQGINFNPTASLSSPSLLWEVVFFFQGEPGNMGPPGTAGLPGRGIPGGKVSSRSANISCCNSQQQQRCVTVLLLVFVRGNQAHGVHLELWESRGWVWADPRWVRHRFALHWTSREK